VGGNKAKDLISEIDDKLKDGNIIGISYHANILDGPFGILGQDNHASSIVGREFNYNTGKCEYILRNSWGSKNCTSPDDPYPCIDGHYWIPEENLSRAIYGVQYVE